MNPPRRGTPDFLFLFLTLALVAFGLLMVFSASSMSATYFYKGDSLHYTKTQAISIGIGLLAMIVLMNIRYEKLKVWSVPFFVVVLILLFLVPIFGKEVKGARSWFDLGPFSLQPSEFAKLGIILYLAALISKKEERFRNFRKGLMPALVTVGIVSGLIMLQPDLGSTMILILCALLVIVVGGANLKHLFLLGLGVGSFGALCVTVFLLVNRDYTSYRINRITAFFDPWSDELGSGFHIIQSLYAFGHGGLTGAGFGQSIQKLHFLPAPHNDFIFSIIGEELGFIGASLFLLGYLLFLWRGIIIALRCGDLFGNLVGIGIMGMIGIQALINLGGVTHAIPLTGVTLPLISYGGSSMLATLMSLGILLSISREQYKPPAAAENNKRIRPSV